MDLGVVLFSGPDSSRTARRAEELGFTHAWFYDSPVLVGDPFQAMALTAAQTDRIKLAPGVLIPTNRTSPTTASALGMLNALAPGRIECGLGTGYSARTLTGLHAMPMAQLERYFEEVRTLLAGETAELRMEGEEHPSRFLNQHLGLINLEDPIRWHLSAFGPRGQSLTARSMDGWLTFTGNLDLAEMQLGQLEEACRREGRDFDSVHKTLFVLGCVLADGEPADSDRAIAQAGAQVALLWHGLVDPHSAFGDESVLPQDLRPLLDDYREMHESYEPERERYLRLYEGHMSHVREDELRFVKNPDLMTSLTFTGTPEQIRERLARAGDLGFDQVALQLAPGHEDALEDWAQVAGAPVESHA